MGNILPQVAGSITLSVSLKQFWLSAPSVDSVSVSSIIHLLPSIILSSPWFCVFRLTKGPLIQKMVNYTKCHCFLNRTSMFPPLIINSLVFFVSLTAVCLWVHAHYFGTAKYKSIILCMHRRNRWFQTHSRTYAVLVHVHEKSICLLHLKMRDLSRNQVPWFWLHSYFKWLMMV